MTVGYATPSPNLSSRVDSADIRTWLEHMAVQVRKIDLMYIVIWSIILQASILCRKAPSPTASWWSGQVALSYEVRAPTLGILLRSTTCNILTLVKCASNPKGPKPANVGT